jgi:uncharacterized membrane protein YqjE
MREPVLVDSSLHRAFSALYAIYVAAAILASFALPPSVETVGGQDLTRFWIVALGIISTTSFVFSLSEKRERKEMISTALLVACLAIYPVALLINGAAIWDLNRLVIGVFTVSFLPLAVWRVLWFFRKYRKAARHG